MVLPVLAEIGKSSSAGGRPSVYSGAVKTFSAAPHPFADCCYCPPHSPVRHPCSSVQRLVTRLVVLCSPIFRTATCCPSSCPSSTLLVAYRPNRQLRSSKRSCSVWQLNYRALHRCFARSSLHYRFASSEDDLQVPSSDIRCSTSPDLHKSGANRLLSRCLQVAGCIAGVCVPKMMLCARLHCAPNLSQIDSQVLARLVCRTMFDDRRQHLLPDCVQRPMPFAN